MPEKPYLQLLLADQNADFPQNLLKRADIASFSAKPTTILVRDAWGPGQIGRISGGRTE